MTDAEIVLPVLRNRRRAVAEMIDILDGGAAGFETLPEIRERMVLDLAYLNAAIARRIPTFMYWR